MEGLSLTGIGASGIFIILVLREVSNFVTKRNGKASMVNMGKLAGQVDEMHEWHKPNTSGEQTWKNPRLAEAINNLNDNVSAQTVVLRELVTDVREMSKDFSRLKGE